MQLSDIRNILNPQVLQEGVDHVIVELLVDSRKVSYFCKSLFFAVSGERNNGHHYINELYQKGVRSFIVSEKIDLDKIPEANVLLVNNSIDALQTISEAHRRKFDLQIIGVTGSNGKTIVKEWLKEILSEVSLVVSSPGSFNSQIGVPLSIWNINARHDYGVFEAGISLKGEMEKLERVILPKYGIFTNIGDAHSTGFENQQEKIKEKAKLFIGCEKVLCRNGTLVFEELTNIYGTENVISWGNTTDSDFKVNHVGNRIEIEWNGIVESYDLPFKDKISVENILHCICMSMYLKVDADKIRKRVQELNSIPMRIQIKKGFGNCDIIDDTYNYDFEGLKNALDFMDQNHRKEGKMLILSDFPKHYTEIEEFEMQLKDLLKDRDIDELVMIGKGIDVLKSFPNSKVYTNNNKFIEAIDSLKVENQTILVKGMRSAHLEKIVSNLEEKIHGTKLEINLNSIVNNLNVFRSIIEPKTKVMAMVKAFAYGSGGSEIAQILEYNKIDYLSVAYVDEGVQLRRDGITVPIMVLNVNESTFEQLLNYNLEPEIYGFKQLQSFIRFLDRTNQISTIHIKIDSGMHRLGFVNDEISKLIETLNQCDRIQIGSIFSHLAISDDSRGDEFTREQIDLYKNICNRFEGNGIEGFDRHILNTSGIIRFPNAQFDMVRLGIGLYDHKISNKLSSRLKMVGKLTTTISQIKEIESGETIGYGRKGVASSNITIATIAIGYADGFSRKFSNGVGEVFLKGTRVKVIGNVCMDMAMIDITGIETKEGDLVEIFGSNIEVNELAEKCGTISYEILTGISSRVKRVFYSE